MKKLTKLNIIEILKMDNDVHAYIVKKSERKLASVKKVGKNEEGFIEYTFSILDVHNTRIATLIEVSKWLYNTCKEFEFLFDVEIFVC